MFVSLVVVHEFGHYIAARRSGVEVEEFGIGFPPRAWAKKLKNKTVFTLNWLPLGGFVKMKGEHDADRSPGSFGAASTKNKTKIMLAGVLMNLLAAWIILTFLAAVGMPRLIDNQFSITSDVHISRQEVLAGYIEPGSPAAQAGLQSRDQLISIQSDSGTYNLNSADNLPQTTRRNAGKDVLLTYKDGNQTKTVNLQLRGEQEVEASKKTNNPKGYLGISPTDYVIQRYTWSAPIEALAIMVQFTKLTFMGLGHALAGLFTGHAAQASAQVSGPVGIFVLLKDGSLLGYQFILMIIAVISLTLAIMNVLPIPALDGGRLFVMLAFRLMKKPLTQTKEEWIHGTGFAALLVLLLLITIVDVRRFF